MKVERALTKKESVGTKGGGKGIAQNLAVLSLLKEDAGPHLELYLVREENSQGASGSERA